jgi:endonuclease/exonuclease/phosphatase (EEP) superfamily protein YafD
VKKSPRSVMVVGDLNDVAWSHTTRLFQRMSGLLDPRIGRGFFNTYHADYPLLRWPLDHVFHSYHLKLCAFKRLPNIGSDHFPILIEVAYDPEQQQKQKVDHASESDKEEANETIKEAE